MSVQRQVGLIVGVSDYVDDPLPAVSNDVLAMEALLTSPQGALAGASVRLLLDQEATADAVLQQLRETCSNVAGQDVLFLYFAGHGAVLNGKYYFVPYGRELIPLEDIRNIFESASCRGAFLFLDICHGGGIVGRHVGERVSAADAREVVSRALTLRGGSGQVIMAACAGHERAFESNGHGHFTKALVEGLEGAAANRQGDVTANSLHDYICHVVIGQTPVFHATLSGAITLIHNKSCPKTQTARPSSQSQVLQVRDSGDMLFFDDFFVSSAQVHEMDNGDWEVMINSNDPPSDARLGEYRSVGGRGHMVNRSVRVAYQNMGSFMNVTRVERKLLGTSTEWRLLLSPQRNNHNPPFWGSVNINGRQFGELDIRNFRAKALIFGRQGLDVGDLGGMILSGCELVTREDLLPSVSEQGLMRFRLRLVSELLYHQVVDHITTLSLERRLGGVVGVTMEGNVSSRYGNRGNQQIRIDGEINTNG